MSSSPNLDAAVWSVVFPGLGQFANGQFGRGLAFLSTAMLGAMGPTVITMTRGTSVAMFGAVGVICLWSIVDAYRGAR